MRAERRGGADVVDMHEIAQLAAIGGGETAAFGEAGHQTPESSAAGISWPVGEEHPGPGGREPKAPGGSEGRRPGPAYNVRRASHRRRVRLPRGNGQRSSRTRRRYLPRPPVHRRLRGMQRGVRPRRLASADYRVRSRTYHALRPRSMQHMRGPYAFQHRSHRGPIHKVARPGGGAGRHRAAAAAQSMHFEASRLQRVNAGTAL